MTINKKERKDLCKYCGNEIDRKIVPRGRFCKKRCGTKYWKEISGFEERIKIEKKKLKKQHRCFRCKRKVKPITPINKIKRPLGKIWLWSRERKECLRIHGTNCVDCGEPHDAVHHLKPINWNRIITAIKEEILNTNTIPLCKVCHSKRHKNDEYHW